MFWWCATAWADNPATVPLPAPAPDLAEYQRLAQEVESLATKNAWAGVERAFRQLLETHGPMTAADWLRGAEAARSVGDIGTTYARVREARKLQPDDREIVEWLYQIDHAYGTVDLACDPGSLIQLRLDTLPFDPEAQRAIRFAQQRIREDCSFQGRLPAGQYRFYNNDVNVSPLVQTIKIDLQGVSLSRSVKKYLKEEWEKTLAAEAPP